MINKIETDPSEIQVQQFAADKVKLLLAASGVAAGTFNRVTVDSRGRVISGENVAIPTPVTPDNPTIPPSLPPSGPAGGDLSGTYPNPSVVDDSHNHTGTTLTNITDTSIAAANKDGLAAVESLRTLGTGAQQACAGNDSRLSDSRTPSGAAGGDLAGTYPNPTLTAIVAATGPIGDGTNVPVVTIDTKGRVTALTSTPITGAPPSGAAGGDLSGTFPNPSVVDDSHGHTGSTLSVITDTSIATANKDGLASVASMRTLGTGAQQATAGNDSRLSDSRAPSGAASGDLSGTYPGPSVVDDSHNHTGSTLSAITDTSIAAANKDGTAITPSMRTLGTGALQAVAGNDSRLSDSRAPNGSAGGDLTGSYPNPRVILGRILALIQAPALN